MPLVSSVSAWKKPISTVEAARLIGVTPTRVRQLIALGYIERIERGKTTAASAARGMARFWEGKVEASREASADRSRLMDARTAEVEERVAKRRREVVPIDEVQEVVEVFVALITPDLEALTARVPLEADTCRKVQEEVDGVRRTMEKVLRQWADYRAGGGDPFAKAIEGSG